MSNAGLRHLDAIIGAALHAAQLADDGTYTRRGAAAIPARFLVDRSAEYIDGAGITRYNRVEISVFRADLGSLIPQQGDVILIDGESFAVERITQQDESAFRVVVK